MAQDELKLATFAGGCFWCMQPPFDKLDGVEKTQVGYAGGVLPNPTYKMVITGTTGHTETMQIFYDPNKVSYAKLLEVFWKNIDPTVKNAQFCDVGSQYRTAIFYHNDEQKQQALDSISVIKKKYGFDEIHTELVKLDKFYLAEEYHQDYYKKNPVRYKYYRWGCGRDKRLKELWDN